MVRKVEGQSIAQSSSSGKVETATVRQGDTLSTVAARHNISEQDLKSANPQLKDPKKLSAGQELVLPEQSPKQGRTSAVGSGAYGTSSTEIPVAVKTAGPATSGGSGADAVAARSSGFSSGWYGIEQAGASIGRQLDNIGQLTNSDGFKQLSPTHQQQMTDALAKRVGDKNFGRELTSLANSPNFRGLSDDDKTQLISNLSTHGSAGAYVRSLNNDQLLTLAESPSGPNQLGVLQEAFQSDGLNKTERAQMDRITTASFTPGDGLTVNGSAADQATYLHMVRREMLNSPSFKKLMNTQNADDAHPITINVGRSQPSTFVDAFNGGGDQTIDLDDFERWPENPVGSPHAITRGQNLVHAMAEARQGALGNDYDVSHKRAIKAENQYRADIGQTSKLKLPPNDTTRDNDGNTIFQFDNGYQELIERNDTGESITGIVHIIPVGKP